MIDNFDVILDRKIRAKQLETSICQGGNKEFYESIDNIIKITRNEMAKIQAVGMEQLFNYLAGNMYSNPDRTLKHTVTVQILAISH